jgi:hypothetical protein
MVVQIVRFKSSLPDNEVLETYEARAPRYRATKRSRASVNHSSLPCRRSSFSLRQAHRPCHLGRHLLQRLELLAAVGLPALAGSQKEQTVAGTIVLWSY